MEKAVIYTRVSTKGQDLTPEEQAAAARRYCEYKGFEVVAVVHDPGKSATKFRFAERPGGQDVERVIEEMGARHVVVQKLDRAFRQTIDCLETVLGWQERGVTAHLLDVNVDTSTASGEFFMTMMAANARFESRRKGERMQDAWKVLRTRGGVLGPAPYGLKNTGSAYRHEEIEEEAAVVEKIRGMLEAGSSYSEIARTLNRFNLRTREGAVWTHTQVARVAKRIGRAA